MLEDSGLHPVGYPSGEPPMVEEPAKAKRPAKARRLIGIALLALLAVVAVVILVPSLLQKSPPRPIKKRPAPAASSLTDLGPLAAVPVLWEKLDVSTMPADVVQDLKSGKYYYDRRLPGNFGLAINYWKQALARPGGAGRDDVRNLLTSAEKELARQFSSDSSDAFVLLKQGRRDQAVILLEKMRADYFDITSPQYVWASVMLSRRRR